MVQVTVLPEEFQRSGRLCPLSAVRKAVTWDALERPLKP
jgi:hypothetical protein